ncbi:aldose epimerase [Alteromonas flava]|uniref:aldose epimerase family protein n=1 Tax=Alteromonas flava TaxID=2048003 RepID=UPI000C282602|nr:aldose epimerase [Alteromonas flava]
MRTFQLTSEVMQVTLSDWGARIVDWTVNVAEKPRRIVLTYPDLQDYFPDPYYVGCIVGPYANRIRDGRVQLVQHSIQLQQNDGRNHLHGGVKALDKQIWDVINHDHQTLHLRYETEDGWNGYPGPITFDVIYTLTGSILDVQLNAFSDKSTVVCLTGHSYFNLNGIDSGKSGLCQSLQSNASHFVPKNDAGLPKAAPEPVRGSMFDFYKAARLDAHASWALLDHNLVFDNEPQRSVITSGNGDLGLVITSDYPAAQAYTGYYLGDVFKANQAICIEPHFGADAPNQSDQGHLPANTPSRHYIRYEIIVE